jgi:hypothetical protein
MARVLRQDTEEEVGILVDLYGPIQSWITTLPFRAWRQPDGALRNYPAVPQPGQSMRAPRPLEVRLSVRNGANGELEVLVPSDLIDFIQHHTGFRSHPKTPQSR